MRAIILLAIAMAAYVNCRQVPHVNIDDFDDLVDRGIVTRCGRGGLKVGSYDRRGVVTDQVNIHALDDLVNRGFETRRGRGIVSSIVDRRGIVHDQVDIDSFDDLASRGIVTRKGKKMKK